MGQKKVQPPQVDFDESITGSRVTISATDITFRASNTLNASAPNMDFNACGQLVLRGGTTGQLIVTETQDVNFTVGRNLTLDSCTYTTGALNIFVSAGQNFNLVASGAVRIAGSITSVSGTNVNITPSNRITATASAIDMTASGLLDILGSDVTIRVLTSGGIVNILSDAIRMTNVAGGGTDVTAPGITVDSSAGIRMDATTTFIASADTGLTLFSALDMSVTASRTMSLRASFINISALQDLNLDAASDITVTGDGLLTASIVGNIALRSSGTFFVSATNSVDIAAIVDVQLRSEGTITSSAVGNIALRSSGTFFVSAAGVIDLKASDIILAASNIISLDAPLNNVTGVPADFTGFNIGAVVADTIYSIIPITRAMTIPSQSGLTAYARVIPGDVVTLTVNHSTGASVFTTASPIGTISWGDDQLAGSVNFATSVVLAVGGFISVQSSAVSASGLTLEDFSWTIKARTS